GEGLDVASEGVGAAAHCTRQLAEDTLLLLERGGVGDGELVPQLDQFLWFDEEGLPASACVVDDAREVGLVLRPERDYVAVAPHGVVGVAEHSHDLLVLQHLFQPRLDAAMQSARSLAQLGEEGARRIEQLARRIEGALQLLGERLEVAQRVGELRMERQAIAERQAEASRGDRSADQARDAKKLLRLQGPFPSGPAQGRPHVEGVGERYLAIQTAELPRFLYQGEPAGGLLLGAAGNEGAALLLAHRS